MAGYGREDAAGEDDLAGRIRRRLRDHGARTEADYEANGRGSAGSPRNGDRGYQGGRRRSGSRGSDGDAGYGDTGRPGGRSDQYGRRPASYRSGTGLIEDGPTALPGIDHGDLGGRGRSWRAVRSWRARGSWSAWRRPRSRRRPPGSQRPGRSRRPPDKAARQLLAAPVARELVAALDAQESRASHGRHGAGHRADPDRRILLHLFGGPAPDRGTQRSTGPARRSAVYSANGKTEIGCFCTTNRTVLTSEQLHRDPYLEQAFFAAEDRHFLTEGGISLTGTARALFVDLTGSGRQGGSTITEQYVKTYFQSERGRQPDVQREAQGDHRRHQAGQGEESKDWILTHYLNSIYLGSGPTGSRRPRRTTSARMPGSLMLLSRRCWRRWFRPHRPLIHTTRPR